MKKTAIISVILSVLLVCGIVPFAFAGQPPIDDTTLYFGTISMGRVRCDPYRAYDTGSGVILMNVYDSLIFTTKEDHTKFVPMLATAWGKDVSGVYGGTVDEPVWWFDVNTTGKVFQPWKDSSGTMHIDDPLTMEDVEYSFKVGLVEDLSGSPMWMYYLPLFESMNMGPWAGADTSALLTFVNEVNSRIWVTGNKIFFKMAFPFPDTAWLQIISQTWGSILNKEYYLDRGAWDGDWFKTVTGDAVGTGTGTQTIFYVPKAAMPYGEAPVFKRVIKGTLSVYLGGAKQTEITDYTVEYRNGTIYFNTAPGAGVAITADYEYAHFFKWRRWPLVNYGPVDQKLATYPEATFNSYRMCGTGPYKLTIIDTTNMYWQIDKFDNSWHGWAGKHLNRIVMSWIDGTTAQWPTRVSKFLAGDYDMIAVPRDSMFDLFKAGWDINKPETWLPLDGVYGIKNILPQITVDAIHPVDNFDPATTYDGTGVIGAGEGIPPDFFHDYRMRRAFAYMFDYTKFLHDAYYDEAEQPTTWSIKGLNPNYADPTLTKWSKDLLKAKADLQAVSFTKGGVTKSAWEWGFKFTILYNTGNKPRETMCYIIRDALTELSTMYGAAGHFSVDISSVEWGTYLGYFEEYKMPFFTIGWLQDFSDPDNFARPYMHSEGDFTYFQNYNNPYVDQLLDWGIHNATYLPSGAPNPAREWCYKQLQRIYMEDVPSFTLDQPFGRFWCRTWVKGWYYNALRPGNYYYDMWKQDTGLGGKPEDVVNTVCDLNFDNKVDMKDIGISIKAFGSVPGGSNWNFYADVAKNMGNRLVDMKDIGWVVSKFGWAATPP